MKKKLTNIWDQVIQPIKTNIPDADIEKIKTSYGDFANIININSNIYKQIVEKQMEQLGEKTVPDKNYFKLINLFGTSLKATYIFADIALNSVLYEIFDTKKTTWPIERFCELALKENGLGLPEYIVRSIWCIKKYRNKIIVHCTEPKIEMYIYDNIGPIHHQTHPAKFYKRLTEGLLKSDTFEDADINTLKNLHKKYSINTAFDYFSSVNGLFYLIPITSNNRLNKDRKVIDEVTSKGGVKSMHIDQIADIINEFILLLIDILDKSGWKTPKTLQ